MAKIGMIVDEYKNYINQRTERLWMAVKRLLKGVSGILRGLMRGSTARVSIFSNIFGMSRFISFEQS